MSYRVPAVPLARLAPRSSLWRRLCAVVLRGLSLRLERHHWRTVPAAIALGKLCSGGLFDSAILRLYRKPRCCGQPMHETPDQGPLYRCVVNTWHHADGLTQAYAMEAIRDGLLAAGIARAGESQMDGAYEVDYAPTPLAMRVVGELIGGRYHPGGWLPLSGFWLHTVSPPRCAGCDEALQVALRAVVRQEGQARYLRRYTGRAIHLRRGPRVRSAEVWRYIGR